MQSQLRTQCSHLHMKDKWLVLVVKISKHKQNDRKGEAEPLLSFNLFCMVNILLTY
jgi:hypothetical protein